MKHHLHVAQQVVDRSVDKRCEVPLSSKHSLGSYVARSQHASALERGSCSGAQTGEEGVVYRRIEAQIMTSGRESESGAGLQ